jgi:hypothetical protein
VGPGGLACGREVVDDIGDVQALLPLAQPRRDARAIAVVQGLHVTAATVAHEHAVARIQQLLAVEAQWREHLGARHVEVLVVVAVPDHAEWIAIEERDVELERRLVQPRDHAGRP